MDVTEVVLSRDDADRERANADRERELAALMRGAQAGEADAYRSLLTSIQPRIRSMVRAKIHDDAAAEDVVQNALLSIHRGRRTYRPERPFGPWMRAIVRNSIIDHFRDRKRRGDREVELIPEEWADERAQGGGSVETLPPELAAALRALPDGQREAVTLVQIEGLSVAEAALRVGISVGAIKVRAHRGYRALRKALEGERPGGEWKSSTPPPTGSRRPQKGGRS